MENQLLVELYQVTFMSPWAQGLRLKSDSYLGSIPIVFAQVREGSSRTWEREKNERHTWHCLSEIG